MDSVAGIVDLHLISKGYLPSYAAGIALPSGETGFSIGITGGDRPMDTEGYQVPVDSFGNSLNGKKAIKFSWESFETNGFARLAWLLLWARTGGVDVIAVSEGFYDYEGNASGVPTTGGGIWWRRNWDNGIYFFSFANKTHLGLDFEFRLEDPQAKILYTLEAAFKKNTSININSAASNNIIRQSIPLPGWNSDNQVVPDLVKIEILRSGSYVEVFTEEEIDSHTFSLKTVTNQKGKTKRNNPGYMELDISTIGTNASVQRLNELWADKLFAAMKYTYEMPDGSQRMIVVKANTISNIADLKNSKTKRSLPFMQKGQVSIRRVVVSDDLSTLTIG